MKKVLSFIILIFITQFAIAQLNLFLDNLDTSFAANNRYVNDYDLNSFLKSKLPEAEIDYSHFDNQLMNATIFFTLNDYRRRKNRQTLSYSFETESLAYNCVKILPVSKFKSSVSNQHRLKKYCSIAAGSLMIKPGLFDAAPSLLQILDYDPDKRMVFNPADSTSIYKLYYRSKVEDSIIFNPIPIKTYRMLADDYIRDLAKGNANKILKSKAYHSVACYTLIEENSLNCRRIPYARVILIFEGRRLARLKMMD